MNNSKTPKIVVGVGLAAIYATGLAIFTMGGANDNVVAQNASAAPTANIASEPVPAPAIVPESTDTSTNLTAQPAALNVAAAPAVSTTAKTSGASQGRGEFVEARLRGSELRVPSVATTSSTEERDVEKSSQTGEGARVGNESANSAGNVSSVQAESASSVNDSQITADRKSEMAAVAVTGPTNVTTNDDVVEQTGAAPSQE